MTKTELERLASLETLAAGMSGDLKEVKGDVKLLLGAYNGTQARDRFLQKAAPWVAIIVSVFAFARS